MPADLFSTFGLSTSALGTAFGLGAFGVFTKYMNYNTAAWGLVGGVICGGNFHLNLMKKLDRLEDWYSSESLRKIKILGILVFLGGCIGLGSYLAIAIKNHNNFTVFGKSAYTTLLTNALTMYAGVSLFCSARRYEHDGYEELNSVT